MSIYKRGQTYWFHFSFEGQHIQCSTKQGNPRVARQLEAAHRTALAKSEFGFHERKPMPTLSDFCRDRVEPWARSNFEHTSLNTWRWYRSGLRSLYAYSPLSDLKLNQITGESAADFAAHRQSKKLQVASVNASLRILRRVLKLAAEWGVISGTPKIKLLRGERHRERVITPEEEAKYLAAAPEPLASVAILLADTGMRPDEVHRLRWESIFFSNGRHGTLLVTSGKTPAARRTLPLTLRVRSMLETRWKTSGKPLEGFIWPAPTKSEHIDHSSLKKQHARTFRTLDEEAKKNGVRTVRPFVLYSYRHTFLTRLAESGCDAWTLARIAGWSDIGISKRYVHPSDDAVLSALSRLPGPLVTQALLTGSKAQKSSIPATVPATASISSVREVDVSD
jgi:integrase